MGFFDKINMAGGRNSAQAFFSGLEALGFKLVHQEGVNSKLEGTYREYSSAMSIDGSGMMRAANASMVQGYGTALAGMAGLIPEEFRDWEEDWAEFKARDRMQRAEMLLKWAIFTDEDAPSEGSVHHDKKSGDKIAKKLYTTAGGRLRDIFLKDSVLNAIMETPFDEIAVKGRQIRAFWTPTMSEYGKVARTPELFAATAARVLDILVLLAQELEV